MKDIKFRNVVPFLCVAVLAASSGLAMGYHMGRRVGEMESLAAGLYGPSHTVAQSALRVLAHPAYHDTAAEPLYVLGTAGGQVAIFCAEGDVKEVTGRAATALPAEEQARLQGGIPLFTEEELMRALQDYHS